jgi:hypothetical protein
MIRNTPFGASTHAERLVAVAAQIRRASGIAL